MQVKSCNLRPMVPADKIRRRPFPAIMKTAAIWLGLCANAGCAARPSSISTAPCPRASMPGGTLGCCVVEDDQGIDGDAGPLVDQERIDVDRGDAGAGCLLYTSPSPRDRTRSRMPSS